MTVDELDEDDLKLNYPNAIVGFTMKSIWQSDICGICSAYLFKYETKSYCCCNGNVKLPIPNPPDELKNLIKNSNNFKTHIRYICLYFLYICVQSLTIRVYIVSQVL